MTDIIVTRPVVARRTEPDGPKHPGLSLGAAIGAMIGAVAEAFAMAYCAPYRESPRPAPHSDRVEEGRDPTW